MKVSERGISGRRKIILILLSFVNLNALETVALNRTNVYRLNNFVALYNEADLKRGRENCSAPDLSLVGQRFDHLLAEHRHGMTKSIVLQIFKQT